MSIFEALDRHFATEPAEHWLRRLREHGVWCGPANRLDDVLTDEHVAAEGYLATLDDGLRTVTMPFDLASFDPPMRSGPQLDADRTQILHDWEISTDSD